MFGRNGNLMFGLAFNNPLLLAAAITPDLETQEEQTYTPPVSQQVAEPKIDYSNPISDEEREFVRRIFGISSQSIETVNSPDKPLPNDFMSRLLKAQSARENFSACFPSGQDPISDLLKENSAQEIQIPISGTTVKNKKNILGNKFFTLDSTTFTVVQVKLVDLIQNFLNTIKEHNPSLHTKLTKLTQLSAQDFEFLGNQVINIIKRHKRAPKPEQKLTFQLSAQELVNLLRRKAQKFTTPA